MLKGENLAETSMCTGQRLKIRITKYILLPTAEANDVGNGAVQGWDSFSQGLTLFLRC